MTESTPIHGSSAGSPQSSGGILAVPLRIFSSIWTGVILLTLLGAYCAFGSIGLWLPGHLGLANDSWIYDIYFIIPWTQIHFRQAPGMEMTEFEWFHFWPFDLLIALICTNIVVVTLRRIPFKPVNYGVWMIHTGILTLSAGSVWYFSTKIEGDSPVLRRQIVIEAPGQEAVTMPAIPGNQTEVGGYFFRVTSIDPEWELLSGDDEGARAFSVTIVVQPPDGEMFLRQVIADYPQYTEDLVRSANPQQPFARAIKERGTALIDEDLSIELAYAPEKYLYLANNISKSWALYLREKGATQWYQRPIDGLPLYNDYIVDRSDVWYDGPGQISPNPLDITVPSFEEGDPLAGIDLHISSYLRYAFMEDRKIPGGDTLDPAVAVRINTPTGEPREFDLAPIDPSSVDDRLRFVWVNSIEQRDTLAQPRSKAVRIEIPGTNIAITEPITALVGADGDFTPIPDTEYAYRVRSANDGLQIGGRLVSVAFVDVIHGSDMFHRWVFSDPRLVRDNIVDPETLQPIAERPVDEGIVMSYEPGYTPPPALVIGGPESDDIGVQINTEGAPEFHVLEINESLELPEGFSLQITRFAAFRYSSLRPLVVPRRQRNSEAREQFAKAKVSFPPNVASTSVWAPYQHYPFERAYDALGRFAMRRYGYGPETIVLNDGRTIEIILSRERMELGHAVVLDDFQIDEHVGGFSGQTTSILNWTSLLRFRDGDKWSEPAPVRVNEPTEHDGLWFFQAGWDPPDEPRFESDPSSAGSNFTVLGVGNRNGVGVQLAGCIIAVTGMLYAFYVKPVIKRRRQKAVFAQVAASQSASAPTGKARVLAASAMEDAS